jgi:hypothetical protein
MADSPSKALSRDAVRFCFKCGAPVIAPTVCTNCRAVLSHLVGDAPPVPPPAPAGPPDVLSTMLAAAASASSTAHIASPEARARGQRWCVCCVPGAGGCRVFEGLRLSVCVCVCAHVCVRRACVQRVRALTVARGVRLELLQVKLLRSRFAPGLYEVTQAHVDIGARARLRRATCRKWCFAKARTTRASAKT